MCVCVQCVLCVVCAVWWCCVVVVLWWCSGERTPCAALPVSAVAMVVRRSVTREKNLKKKGARRCDFNVRPCRLWFLSTSLKISSKENAHNMVQREKLCNTLQKDSRRAALTQACPSSAPKAPRASWVRLDSVPAMHVEPCCTRLRQHRIVIKELE